jgi:hypothetical protein
MVIRVNFIIVLIASKIMTRVTAKRNSNAIAFHVPCNVPVTSAVVHGAVL